MAYHGGQWGAALLMNGVQDQRAAFACDPGSPRQTDSFTALRSLQTHARSAPARPGTKAPTGSLETTGPAGAGSREGEGYGQ